MSAVGDARSDRVCIDAGLRRCAGVAAAAHVDQPERVGFFEGQLRGNTTNRLSVGAVQRRHGHERPGTRRRRKSAALEGLEQEAAAVDADLDDDGLLIRR